MQSYITAIGIANPRHKLHQKEVLNFMLNAHGLKNAKAHDLEVLYRASGIKTRYTVLEDYKKSEGYNFFPNSPDLEPFPTTAHRNGKYGEHALGLSIGAVQDCLRKSDTKKEKITHLITVSCTGLHAPGMDIELIYKLDLKHDIQRTAINFMGCYAAINALKVADAICKSQEANVLIVCTELCSLHFQKSDTEDNLLANALFGDGSAAVLVQSESQSGLSLSPQLFSCDLVPSGEKDMAWTVGDHGFEMKLSAYVPEVIKDGIDKLLDKINLVGKAVDYYALHPGGKKILKVIENKFGITKQDNVYAYNVLKNYGNMSSPTVLFVLAALMDDLKKKDEGKRILSLAFGPGLTLESMILKINHG